MFAPGAPTDHAILPESFYNQKLKKQRIEEIFDVPEN